MGVQKKALSFFIFDYKFTEDLVMRKLIKYSGIENRTPV